MEQPAANAAGLYASMKTQRQAFIDEAVESARLTIPSLFPKEGHANGSKIEKPRNGIGARGVNHMASRLLMATLPSRASFFRMIVDGKAEEILGTNEKGKAEVELALADMEREVQKSIATGALRVPAGEGFKQLVVAGNVLEHIPEESEDMQVYPLSQYVVERDLEDNLTLLILCEEVAIASLDAELRVFVEDALLQAAAAQTDKVSLGAGLGREKTTKVYTKVWLESKDKYAYRQEVAGAIVPKSEGFHTADTLPWRPLRWARVYGEAYGRSLVSEYHGTLLDIEILTKSLVEGAVAAARVIPLVNPSGGLDPEDLNGAENGEAIFGDQGDLTFAQLNKFADFRVAREELEDKRRELSSVFLLNVTRASERTTAEEIRLFADELEASHAGTFTLMASEFQLPLIKRILRRLTKNNVIPGIQKELQGHIKPAIVTGVDALGRSEDMHKLGVVLQMLAGALGSDVLGEYTNPGTIIQYAVTSSGLDIPGAMKTDDEVAAVRKAQQEAAMKQSAIDKATGPAVAGLANNPAAAAELAKTIQPQ